MKLRGKQLKQHMLNNDSDIKTTLSAYHKERLHTKLVHLEQFSN